MEFGQEYFNDYLSGEKYGRKFVDKARNILADLGIVGLHKVKSFVDLGCATGILVKDMLDRGIDAWGIDISDWALNRLVDSSLKERCFRGDVKDIGKIFNGKEFDVAYVNSFMYLPKTRLPKIVRAMLPIFGHVYLAYENDPAVKDQNRIVTEGSDWWKNLFELNGWISLDEESLEKWIIFRRKNMNQIAKLEAQGKFVLAEKLRSPSLLNKKPTNAELARIKKQVQKTKFNGPFTNLAAEILVHIIRKKKITDVRLINPGYKFFEIYWRYPGDEELSYADSSNIFGRLLPLETSYGLIESVRDREIMLKRFKRKYPNLDINIEASNPIRSINKKLRVDYPPKAVRDYIIKTIGARISRAKHLGDKMFHEETGTTIRVDYFQERGFFSIHLKLDQPKFRNKLYKEFVSILRKSAIPKKSTYKITTTKSDPKDFDRGVVEIRPSGKDSISIHIWKR